MADTGKMDRNLALEAVRVTEAAALAASKLMGRGDEKMADQAAVDAMRTTLNSLAIEGTVVIGEGERDEAPMLYIGEKVGGGGPKIDIALDPLEGTTITAKGLPNALAVMAMAEHGGFLNAPDVYMDKIAVGGGLPDGIVDLDKTPKQNLADLAKAKSMVTQSTARLSSLNVPASDPGATVALVAQVAGTVVERNVLLGQEVRADATAPLLTSRWNSIPVPVVILASVASEGGCSPRSSLAITDCCIPTARANCACVRPRSAR